MPTLLLRLAGPIGPATGWFLIFLAAIAVIYVLCLVTAMLTAIFGRTSTERENAYRVLRVLFRRRTRCCKHCPNCGGRQT